jgi:hypothetical protein
VRPTTTLRDALSDPALLGHVLQGPSWLPWRVLLIAAMGEALTDGERSIFTQLTGRAREPLTRVNEFEAIVGRRGGKTSAMAAGATYLATCCDHTDALARGETGVLLCVAQDTKIAKLLLDRIEANLQDSEILRQLIKGRTQDSIELTNNISIEVKPASFRRLRGPTYVGILADELAFWFTSADYAHPDVEVLAAARPGLLTTHGPLIMASSPYAKMGVLWDTYRKHYGPDGAPSVLVAKGATRTFNSSIPQSEIDRELERDRARNTAELLAEFRSDLESYVSLEVVESCVGSYYEIPPAPATSYYAFTDPSGGSEDAFSLAISHRDGERVVVDCIREVRPPFSPEQVIAEFAGVLRNYHCHRVTGDRYGGEFPREQFRKRGIHYEVSQKMKSDIYVDFLPVLNSGRVTLPRNEKLVRQLCSLERTTARGSGKDNIDHPRDHGMHDDIANAWQCHGRPDLWGLQSVGPGVFRAGRGGGGSAAAVAGAAEHVGGAIRAHQPAGEAGGAGRPASGRGGGFSTGEVGLFAPSRRAMMRLTDHQLAQLQQAASLLPVESRDAFLRGVAHHLGGIKRSPTNGDVSTAIIAVLGDTSVRITTPVFLLRCATEGENRWQKVLTFMTASTMMMRSTRTGCCGTASGQGCRC